MSVLLAACSNPFASGRETRLHILDFETPQSVTPSGPLDAVAVVRVGGCTSFRRLDVARGSSLIHIAAIGHDASGPGINCPADIRDERRPLRVNGPFADSIVLTGKQPDGSILRRHVSVSADRVTCVTSITTRPASLLLQVGDTARVSARACNAAPGDFTWSATPAGVVAVSDSGFVTAMKAGSAAVVGRLRSDSRVFAAVATTVLP